MIINQNQKPKLEKKCLICGKNQKKITASHLKTHGVSYTEYIKKYEPEYYHFRELKNKLLNLYFRQRNNWLEQKCAGKYINCTSNSQTGSNGRDFILNKQDIEAHLLGAKTLGVIFPDNYTHMMGLDIDFRSEQLIPDGAMTAFTSLVEIIKDLGLRQASLPSYSGSKGFHIDIFFKDNVNVKYVEKFYQKILKYSGYNKSEVELRGGKSSSGYKIPLGLHQKTERWCDIQDINDNFIHFESKIFDYKKAFNVLDDIEPISVAEFIEIVKKFDLNLSPNKGKVVSINQGSRLDDIVKESKKVQKNSGTDSSWKKTYKNKGSMENIALLKNLDLTCPGTRNSRAYLLGNLLAQAGCNENVIFNELKKWHSGLNKRFYTTDREGCFKEYKSIAKRAVKNKDDWEVEPVTFVGGSPTLTVSDYHDYILKPDSMVQRKIMFALVSHAKVFLSENNDFYMSYNQINTVCGTNNSEDVIKERISELEKQNLVEVVASNIKMKGTCMKHANYYRIPGLELKDLTSELSEQHLKEEHFKKCPINQMECKNCFLRSCKSILSEEVLDEKFGGVYKKRLKFNYRNGCPHEKKKSS